MTLQTAKLATVASLSAEGGELALKERYRREISPDGPSMILRCMEG
jgi:hypothetical protein